MKASETISEGSIRDGLRNCDILQTYLFLLYKKYESGSFSAPFIIVPMIHFTVNKTSLKAFLNILILPVDRGFFVGIHKVRSEAYRFVGEGDGFHFRENSDRFLKSDARNEV